MTAARQIHWSAAIREDREQLHSFSCAVPAKKQWDAHRHIELPHPQPWAFRVQSDIRTQKPPKAADEEILMGRIDGELAAVSHIAWTDDRDDHPQLMILALARSTRFARQGLGDLAMSETLDVLRKTRDDNNLPCGAFARIDKNNIPSQRLFLRSGFELLDDFDDGSKLQYWVHNLL